MMLDIEQVKQVIKSLETLKQTKDLREDERDILHQALIPLRLFLIMRQPEEMT